jgi:hypothetical protein
MEYLVVLLYLFLFISFWRFLTYREKKPTINKK